MLTQISASAGSGKTYTLTRLFIDLIEKSVPGQKLGGVSHERDGAFLLAGILAATFTNKAAAEMKSRVIAGLKEEALRRNANGENRSTAEVWVERILRHYSRLNIRTIDSLLAALTRLSALELRLPPDFEPSFDPGEYFTPFYDSLMEDLSAAGGFLRETGERLPNPGNAFAPFAPCPPPALDAPSPHCPDVPLFLTTDAAALQAGLAESCRSLLFISECRGFSPKRRLHDLLLELTERLMLGLESPETDTGAIHAKLRALHGAVVESSRDMLLSIAQADLKANVHYLRFLTACAGSAPYRPLPESAYLQKSRLDECLNKSSQGSAPAAAERAFARTRAAFEAYIAALPVFRHALQLAPLAVLAREIHRRMRADAAARLLPALLLPGLAGKALNGEAGVSDALCRLGSRLSRLLLDEFQDTSRDQWSAILPLAVESLSAGGSLTYVGDVKQAIYSWRGGDARLFDAVLEEPELRAIAPTPHKLELRYNWRSHPAVIAHNNAFFSLLADPAVARATLDAMLPPHTPEEYRAQAASGAAKAFSQVRQEVPPQKQWENDPGSKAATVRLYMAEAGTVDGVCALVRERMRSLFLNELLPVWKYGDIAVLVRSGDEAALVAEWLTAWGLPVVTENSFLLASHPLVSRLVSFLTFLDYPPDDLSFWEFASGPECLGRPGALEGRTPADWLAGTILRQGDNRPVLYQLFRRDFPALWESCVAPFLSGAGIMSAYDTLFEAVKRFSLMARMPEQTPFLLRLMEIAHLAESRGHSSLAAFLSFWRECKENEKLPLPENMDAVRIMTIHKAKGLEFPVVVLPFQHKGKRRDPALTAAVCEGIPLLTRAGRELAHIHYPACITDEIERLNLLYVAWTRPVYALHAFITRPKSSSTPLTRALETLLAFYRERGGEAHCQWEDTNEPLSAGQAGANGPGPSFPVPAKTRESSRPAHDPFPLGEVSYTLPPLPWQPMNWLPRLKIYRSPLPDPSFTPRQRGILTHLCLEQLILSPESGTDSPQCDVDRAVRQGIRLFPLPLQDPEGIAREMAAGLAWFSSLPEARFWLAHGLREREIMDEAGRMHRVDLLVDPSPTARGSEASTVPLYALDYKTGQEYEEHERQVRRYMRLAASASGRTVYGLLAYLDTRRLVRLEPEGLLP